VVSRCCVPARRGPARSSRPALVVVFTVAAAQALARDINIDCGCFGSVRAPVTIATIARDLAFLAAGLAVIVLAPAANETAPRVERPGG